MLSWFMTLNGTIIIMALYLTSKGPIIKPPVIITEGFSFAVEGGEEENSGKAKHKQHNQREEPL